MNDTGPAGAALAQTDPQQYSKCGCCNLGRYEQGALMESEFP